jgi:hypothetical protein
MWTRVEGIEHGSATVSPDCLCSLPIALNQSESASWKNAAMKSHPKIAALLPLAAIFFATAFAVTNASAKDIHIKGPMEATEDHVVTPPNMVTQLEGVGHARAIGRYALTIEATIYLPTRTGLGGHLKSIPDAARLSTEPK